MVLVQTAPDFPSGLLQKTSKELWEGDSPFSSVLVVGAYTMVDPRTEREFPQIAVASQLAKGKPDELARLADKLRQVAGDLDTIAATERQVKS